MTGVSEQAGFFKGMKLVRTINIDPETDESE